ncbi:hypothetical protein IW262DRAFT_1298551 [Armillaria fumosa]|nr:hypothetical protein IW262DRAFT_1298551 [Armillaria fumosa]
MNDRDGKSWEFITVKERSCYNGLVDPPDMDEEEEEEEDNDNDNDKEEEDKDEKKEGKEDKKDELEEEADADDYENSSSSSDTPLVKRKRAKGYTKTGWPLLLNQQLREGRTQPVMRSNMEDMEGEGLLMVSWVKCTQEILMMGTPLVQSVSSVVIATRAMSPRVFLLPKAMGSKRQQPLSPQVPVCTSTPCLLMINQVQDLGKVLIRSFKMTP